MIHSKDHIHHMINTLDPDQTFLGDLFNNILKQNLALIIGIENIAIALQLLP